MPNTSISLRTRLFGAFALVTVIAVVLPLFVFRSALYQDRIDVAGREALANALFTRSILESSPSEEQVRQIFATAAGQSFRMTLADKKGTVLRDSHVGESGLAVLDNHNDRPEIEAARASGSGVALRHSNTLGFDAVYAAVVLKSGGILRVAVPLEDIHHRLEGQFPMLLGMAGGVGLFCLFLSALITHNVRRRMDTMAEVVASISRNPGKGRPRLRDVHWREMLPLAYAVNHMADTIEAYVVEITDQQGQLETILDSMHEGVLVLGPNGRVRRWNKALARLFPAVEQAEGMPLVEAIPLPALQARVDRMLGGEKIPAAAVLDDDAIHFEVPPGHFLVAHVSSPVTPNDSLGAVIVIYDATEIMRLERVRKDFVSNVSHELRTPLTAIAGYSETLAVSDDLDGDYKKFAAIIHKHAVALSGIIDNLLALARIEDRREAIPLAIVAVQPVIRDALVAVQEQADEKNLALHIEPAQVSVFANANLLTRVFANLLENACRYSPQNGEIRISFHRQGDEVLFCVSDNGPGIPTEALPRIFERFYQVKRERNSGTSGIGLAICKHIVERHNGRIWAESPHEDAATAMLFTIPAALTET